MRRISTRPAAGAICLALAGLFLASCAAAPAPRACLPVGGWVEPATGAQQDDAIARLARRGVVLLGETHDNAEHHRWQLHTAAALQARRPDMVLGFEMFPRRVQPVLDRWVAGDLAEADFLREVGWEEVWGFDADLYLPLFHFARMHRVQMVALNVERGLVGRIAKKGLESIPAAEREGVGAPAAALPAYRAWLFEIFSEHGPDDQTADAQSDRFKFFVEAQLFWDRAMAEAIAGARRGADVPLVVGIMGQGHVKHGAGVAHQLRALGIADVATALPWPATECDVPEPDIADLVFGVAATKDEAEGAEP